MTTAQYLSFLGTSPLWQEKQFGIQQFEFPELDIGQFQPRPIPPNLRLGHRVEKVFKQLITYADRYEILVYNLPVRDGERTLGEIDFILKDKTHNKFIHVELTYKFYVIDPALSEPIHQLIGPNRRDTFFEKKEKIKNKQFPLLHTAAGIKVLVGQGIDHQAIEHQCCFKAQLFKPYGEWNHQLGSFNEQCLAGHWLRFDDFKQAEFTKAQYYMPSKSEWVMEPHRQVAWKSQSEILLDIEQSFQKEKAPMLWMKKSEDVFGKLFVVWW